MAFNKRRFLVVCLAVILMCVLSYFGMAYYYRGSFIYGTWINGVYCTGRSVEEVNQLLLENTSVDTLTLIFADNEKAEIDLYDIILSFDYTEKLEKYIRKQTPLNWWKALLNQNKINLTPTVQYEEAKLEKVLGKVSQFQRIGLAPDEAVLIQKTKNGYELLNYEKHLLSKETAFEVIKESLSDGVTQINLEEENCYKPRSETKKTKEIFALWQKLEKALDMDIVYELGDDRYELINHKVLSDWIVLDEEGEFLLDDEGNFMFSETAVEVFVKNLAEKYDTVGITREFYATRGEWVEVSGGIYGNQINQQAEIEFIWECLNAHKNATRIPEYQKRAKYQGKDDIGNTYIEVDMTEQMMYYYIDGELFVETPVVTGNAGRKWDTPCGTNYVYGKQKNRILRGANYATFVNFWMPVNGNIGIHDASWRKEYGGEIYKTNGSHGCINTPYDKMEEIYENTEVGTPVVMFY